MTETKIIEMIKELEGAGIIGRWYQDYDGTIIIEEWIITNGKEFERASAFAHIIQAASKSIGCDDGVIECTLFVEGAGYPLDVIISCVWL